MISVRAYRDGAVDDVEPSEVRAARQAPNQLVWADVTEPSDEELDQLRADFDLHHLELEDVHHRFPRPKLAQHHDHLLLVLHTRSEQEVDVIAAAGWAITISENGADPGWSADDVRRRLDQSRPDQTNAGFLLYLVLDEIVDGYFDVLDRGEDRLEDLEEKVFADEPLSETEVQRELFDARRRLLRFRRAVAPLQAVVSSLLRGEVDWIDDDAKLHLHDVLDHVLRVVDSLDNGRDLLGNIMDAHLAIISNRMNSVMKKMTSWGAILLVSALVASIYGMNFVHMPELKWELGYPYALGLMAAIALFGYWSFKRKDWL